MFLTSTFQKIKQVNIILIESNFIAQKRKQFEIIIAKVLLKLRKKVHVLTPI